MIRLISGILGTVCAFILMNAAHGLGSIGLFTFAAWVGVSFAFLGLRGLHKVLNGV